MDTIVNTDIESAWLFVDVGDPCLNKKIDKKRSERRALRAKFAKRRSVKLHSHEHSLRNKKLERVTALEVRYELAA